MTPMQLSGQCVEPGCQADGQVGLQGAWVCLDHFDARLKVMRAALHPAVYPRKRLVIVRGQEAEAMC